MNLNYGYTMLDENTAACPLPDAKRDWQVSGVDKDEATFELPGGGTYLARLPFYSGATCSTKLYTLAGEGSQPATAFWLLFPDPQGNRQMEVTVERDRDLWFAVARLSPAKKR